jgi:serine/threonine-protein kinase haspin
MPQVYGKKKRAVYCSFAAFSSPSGSSDVDVGEVARKLERAKLSDDKKRKTILEKRTALKEKDANTITRVPDTDIDDSKGRLVEACIDAVDDGITLEGTSAAAQKSTNETRDNDLDTQVQTRDLTEEKSSSERHDHDDVPLFVEDHGYDSADNEEIVATHGTPREQRASKEYTWDERPAGPDTPSITILPPTPPIHDVYSEHCSSLVELSHHPMTDFLEWATQLSSHFSITKIAEASFGEVYRLKLLEDLPGFSANDESVFKVIALKPPTSTTMSLDKRKRDAAAKKAESMSNPNDVANEVRLLQRMSVIPGFTNFRDVRVVKGRPPTVFAKAFKAFNTAQKTRKKELSHFPDPAKKSSYAEDQLWAVIEMQDAGTDLECLVERGDCTTIWFAWDVFWQVVLSLAKGEEGAEFEHRDLHLGNICVRQPPESVVKNVDTKRKLNFTGLETTIIDYTISRAVMSNSSIAYQDLARDNGLFEGDSTEEYQYDIYRYMRGAVVAGDPYAEPPFPSPDRTTSWQQYHPFTNLIWLHFILYKLLEEITWPSAQKAPPRKQKEAHARWKRANDLEHVLLRVQELLDPAAVCRSNGEIEGPVSASCLVELALTEGWLDVEDVVGAIDEGGDDEEDPADGTALVEQLEHLDVRVHSIDELTRDTVPAEPKQPRPRMRRK